MTSSRSLGLVSMLLVLQFLLVSGSLMASTKYIDKLCHFAPNQTFCLETVTAYPPAVSATNLFQLVETVFRLGRSSALKTARFAASEATKTSSTLKKQFKLCNASYVTIERNLRVTVVDLKGDSPDLADYDVMICYDSTKYVKDLIGKNRDKASKRIMNMTLHMEKFLKILLGATHDWVSEIANFKN